MLEWYNKFVKVTEIFPINNVGIVTSRDDFVIDLDRNLLERRIRQFRDRSTPKDFLIQTYKLKDKEGWKLDQARAAVQGDDGWGEKVIRFLYRPFDERWLFYHPAVIERGRIEVMRHKLVGKNVALCIGRAGQVVGEEKWNLIFCSSMVDYLNLFYRGGNVNFPLYLYPSTDRHDLFSHHEISERKPNLNPEVIARLEQGWNARFLPHPLTPSPQLAILQWP